MVLKWERAMGEVKSMISLPYEEFSESIFKKDYRIEFNIQMICYIVINNFFASFEIIADPKILHKILGDYYKNPR